jgi:hypothetical protein
VSYSHRLKTEAGPVSGTSCFPVIYNSGRWKESINPMILNNKSLLRNVQIGSRGHTVFDETGIGGIFSRIKRPEIESLLQNLDTYGIIIVPLKTQYFLNVRCLIKHRD